MYLKCPHCHGVREYSENEYRKIFIRCKICGKDFRQAECSPLTGGEAAVRETIPKAREVHSELERQMKQLQEKREEQTRKARTRPAQEQPENPKKQGFWDRLKGKKI